MSFAFKITGLSSLVAVFLLLPGCGKVEIQEKLTTVEQRLTAAQGQITSKDGEIKSLQQRVAALEEENTRLKQTAQFFYDEGQAAMKKKDWNAAATAFTSITDRFPLDPLAREARRMLGRINDERLGAYLATLDAALSFSDKRTYTLAVDTLTQMIGECSGCTNAGAARTRQEQLKTTLASWPEDIDSIWTMKVRYSDLRGKPLRIATAVAAAGTYYNCEFQSDTTWRSITIATGTDSDQKLHVYCRKGAEFCETLFNSLVGGDQRVRDVSVKYPNSSEVCAENQAELLGWSR